jgi:hypothetical protein
LEKYDRYTIHQENAFEGLPNQWGRYGANWNMSRVGKGERCKNPTWIRARMELVLLSVDYI